MFIVSKIILLVLSLYAALLLYLMIKLTLRSGKRSSPDANDDRRPGVSIVIPFRNEAKNLERLLESLESQTYEGDMEILLINDGSADNYREVVASRPWKKPVRTIDADFSADRQLTSKQQALDTGIRLASYDRIAFTDADMVLEPQWLGSLVAAELDTGAALVFGHTGMKKEATASFLDWFQGFQLEALFAAAYAFDKGNIPGSCMGNNMLISRPAYLNLGGYDAIGYSIVEDRDLLAAFRKKRLRTTATEPFHPTAQTFPLPSLREYLHQLLRWAYGGFRNNSALSLFGLLLTAQNFLLLLALMNLLSGNAALLAFANLLLTWLFISIVFHSMKSDENPVLFWPFFALLVPESFALLFLLLFRKPVVWKNREI